MKITKPNKSKDKGKWIKEQRTKKSKTDYVTISKRFK